MSFGYDCDCVCVNEVNEKKKLYGIGLSRTTGLMSDFSIGIGLR